MRITTPIDEMKQNGTLPPDNGDAHRLEYRKVFFTICAEVLEVGIDELDEDQSWVALGSDSIAAIALIARCEECGMRVKTADVIQCTSIAELFETVEYLPCDDCTTDEPNPQYTEVAPFALWPKYHDATAERREDLLATVARCCQVISKDVEDVYPCTPLQEGLMAITSRNAAAYVDRRAFDLAHTVDLTRFRTAWETLMARTPILRTRIVMDPASGRAMQVVVRDDLVWREAGTLEQYLEADQQEGITLGQPLARYGLVQNKGRAAVFVWTVHHSIYDGWSARQLYQELAAIYRGQTLPPAVPYTRFVRYLLEQDSARAAKYWREKLYGENIMADWPALPTATYQPRPRAEFRSSLLHPNRSEPGLVMTSAIIRGAWALVMAQYSGHNDVIFGTTLSGRNAPVPQVADITAPLITTVPVRIRLDQTMTIWDYLHKIQQDTMQMIDFEHTGLQQIKTLVPESVAALDFRNLLIIQPAAERNVWQGFEGVSPVQIPLEEFDSYALNVECTLGRTEIELQVNYDEDVIATDAVANVMEHFGTIVSRLSTAGARTTFLHEIMTLPVQDEAQIRKWNGQVPSPEERCIQDLVHDRVCLNPSATAVIAWDGQLTYTELNYQSMRLAQYLTSLGVCPERTVGLCMDKSKWAVVAMLAILYAGGAVLPLAGNHPLPRLQEIIRDADVTVIVTDASQGTRLASLDRSVITVDSKLVGNLPVTKNAPHSGVTPQNMAWVMYTSGSTGKPKGVVLQHQSLCTMLMAHARGIGINERTRALQFASYTFDVSVSDTFSTLQAGGCVCVPSEDQRLNSLAETAAQLQINYAELTSTVAEMLSPSQIPSMDTLLLSGEPLKPSVLATWALSARVFNSYGPTECSITVSNSKQLFHHDEARNIGAAMQSLFWVTHKDDPQALVPIGVPGELLIEGPLLARGYLNNETATTASFITDPLFIKRLAFDRPGRRMYRTGDLVQQNRDGSLIYLGRCGGQQIKIRGQRVDVGEVEYQIAGHFPGVKTVAVELVGQGNQLSLMAVMDFSEKTTLSTSTFYTLRKKLLRALPQYMVPTLYMPTDHITINGSGKLDRQWLRAQLQAMTGAELQQYALNMKSKTEPATEMEHQLQSLWAETLAIEPDRIGSEDSFVLLGGDSVAAMRMVSLQAAQQLQLTVADIFQHTLLSDLARVLEGRTHEDSVDVADPAPFALWKTNEDQRTRRTGDIAAQCGVTPEEIEDILPCTPMQEGLIAVTAHQPTAYVGREIVRMAPSIDIQRFQEAWQTLVVSSSILRTRAAIDHDADSGPHAGGLVQVVVRGGLTWNYGTTLDDYLERDQADGITIGQPLVRLGLVQNGKERYFVWTAHHSVYDGWSAFLIYQRLAEIYLHGCLSSPSVPYTRFMRHLLQQDRDTMASYWSSQLHGEAVVDWPSLPRADYQPTPMHRKIHTFKLAPGDECSSRSRSLLPHCLRAAWALVMATYAGGQARRVVFGATISGRNAPVRQIAEILGPTITTVPVAVQIDGERTVGQFLEAVCKQAADMIPFEQTGLQVIRKLVPQSQAMLDLRNLFLVQSLPESGEMELAGLESLPVKLEGFDSYGLTVLCSPETDTVRVEMRYDENVISSSRVQSLLSCFDHVLNQVYNTQNDAVPLRDLSLLNARDSETIAQWNSAALESVEKCIHDLFDGQATARPDSVAIHAWDGNLTYAELKTRATQLSQSLQDKGVCAERMVGVCMDKSKWVGVAMLAILYAGGVVVPLGVNYPAARIAGIVKDTKLDIILVDAGQWDRVSTMPINTQLKVVDQSLFESLPGQQPIYPGAHPNATPDNAAWVIYTSGSTGKPKGAVLQHRALCTSIRAHGARFQMGHDTRVLQFAAHTFDLCIQDYFTTLSWGGVVCVPSEDERMSDLTSAIRTLGTTFATLTSTVARLIDPSDAVSMQQLVLVGEPVKADVVQRWLNYATVLNAYGPSECSMHATCSKPLVDTSQAATIGTAMGSRLWVTDVRDHNRLCPIGVPGELLIEGPILGREYLNDPAKTQAAFITSPAFLEQVGFCEQDSKVRMYRTGDLVRLNENGSLTHLGRRDTQIKIRGQRVEVGEIEYQITQLLPGAQSAAVQLLEDEHGSQVSLMAVMDFVEDSDLRQGPVSDLGILTPSRELLTALKRLRGLMFQTLPSYMVPAAFLPVIKLPLNASGKLDRRAVRELLQSVPIDVRLQYLAQSVSSEDGSATPSTPIERQIQAIWADILQVTAGQISIHDNFFQIGGDSVVAMRLVATPAARELQLTVRDIFRSPRLADLAELLSSRLQTVKADDAEDDPEVFSLWLSADGDLQRRQDQLQQIAHDCNIPITSILDVYPCTPLQEQMMAVNARQRSAYINRQVFQLEEEINQDRLRAAWQDLAKVTPILRTRICLSPGTSSLIQVVVNEEMVWQRAGSLQDYLDQDLGQGMALGQPLIRFGLVHDESSGHNYLIWTTHHCLYDGWSVRLIYQHVAEIYHAGRMPSPGASFARFIRFLVERDTPQAQSNRVQYWSDQLQGVTMSNWPPLPHVDYQPVPGKEIIRTVALPLSGPGQSVTPANVVRAAWAMTMAQYTGHDDVVFAATVSGRNVPVWQVESMVAPLITTVPVRTNVDWTLDVATFIGKVQDQAAEMIPYEHTGLRTIKTIISSELRPALDLRNVLVVQTGTERDTSRSSFPEMRALYVGSNANFDSHGLTVDCTISSENLQVAFRFDEAVLPTAQAERILSHFTHLIQQLCGSLQGARRTLSDLDLVSPADKSCIFDFNNMVDVSRVDACIHELVNKQVLTQPDALAVCAWDGELQYNELSSYAARLAYQLVEYGVGPEKKVGLCMDKSRWAVVAMLAILQAGGSVVPLGVSHPLPHLDIIIQDSAASVIIVDEQQQRRLAGLRTDIPRMHINGELLQGLTAKDKPPVISTSPDNAAWIIYTSGSTGTPKGVVLEHGGLCTSMRTQAAKMHITNKTRALQFSPFTFDVSISDVSATLIHGGCVCLPSESDRVNKLAGSVRAMNVNFASLTPTVARLLSPTEVPSLRTLALTGEALKPDVVALWQHPNVALFNTYGPSEGSVCTCNGPLSSPDQADNIGTPMSTRHWVTQPHDYHQLSPVGAPGELLIEGPLMAREYLSNPEKTAASFVLSPKFLTTPSGCRIYRTGDLVLQNADASFTYLGRQDTQVKIRGQRVEIGEIEHQIVYNLKNAEMAVVNLIEPTGLIAAVKFKMVTQADILPTRTLAPTPALCFEFTTLQRVLSQVLPDYMVPAFFVPVSAIPMNISGKLDRRAVHAMLTSLPTATLGRWTADKQDIPQAIAPGTEIESDLQELWARMLSVPTTHVSPQDNFFRLSGDSVTAMRMVATATCAHRNWNLVVADIFKYPRLSDLARVLDERVHQNAAEVDNFDPEPFALWGDLSGLDIQRRQQQLHTVAGQCEVEINQIKDVYPCTRLQEAMLASTARQPSAYISRQVYALSEDIDLDRFKGAWEQLASVTPILRTRIIIGANESWQVIVDDPIAWLHPSIPLDDYIRQDTKHGMRPGQPLARYAILEQPFGEKFFVWTAHHSIYDGWTVRLLCQELINLYHRDGYIPGSVPYTRFIRYLGEMDQIASATFWEQQLSGDDVEADWPRLPHVGYEPKARSTLDLNIAMPEGVSGIVMATVVRAAWALVMAQFSGHEDIVFAANVSGRTAPVPGVRQIIAPTGATVPVRVRTNAEKPLTVEEFLQGVQSQAQQMLDYEQTGLLAMRNHQNLQIRNLLVIQPAEESDTPLEFPGIEPVDIPVEDFDSYGINVECTLGRTIKVQARFDEHVVAVGYMKRVLNQFAHIAVQLWDPSLRTLPLKQINPLHLQDHQQIATWNAVEPECVDRCVHETVEKQAKLRPTELAVWAWDGQFTYETLVGLARDLADKLGSLGVGPERMVAVCMAKSKWAAVAFLAVLMAGGAVVPLGVNHPIRRIETILNNTKADLVLVDAKQRQRLAVDCLLGRRLLVVDAFLEQHLLSSPPSPKSMTTIAPSNAAWVIFTSGTTGVPKGAVIEHRAISSSIRAHGTRYGFGHHTRKLQYAAHTFDGTIEDYLTTLSWGGLCCVPSEDDRLDMGKLTAFMRLTEVNALATTYTVAGLFTPSQVPSLRILVLGGEPATVEVTDTWRNKVNLFNCYGPSECTIFSSAAGPVQDLEEIHNIGQPIGTRLWIVNSENPDQLCPIGAPGELLIEGPQLARGYLHDEAKTTASFLTDPAFMRQFELTSGRRVYRSGDIVRQNENGSLVYVARRNNMQVKIRGQRVEIGEIETQISLHLSDTRNVAVELLKRGSQQLPVLVAVVDFADNSQYKAKPTVSEGFLAPTLALQETFKNLLTSLSQVLQRHMVPSIYVPVAQMPRNVSGKLDRRALRGLLDRMPYEDMHQYLDADTGARVLPSTEMERTIQTLWARILGIDEIDRIGVHHNFFQLGGDSVAAMRLAAIVQQEENVQLKVADILTHPCLGELAKILTERAKTPVEKETECDPEPFSMAPNEHLQSIATRCGVAVDQIQDVYPATSLQEGFIAVTTRQSSAYISRQVYGLAKTLLDLDQFKAAWEKLVDQTPILRTRLYIGRNGRVTQVVVREPIQWRCATNLASYIEQDREEGIKLDGPLVRYAIVTESTMGNRYFVWTAHHSIYDAWTMRALSRTLSEIYTNPNLSSPIATIPYSRFIRYVARTDTAATRDFWDKQLTGDAVADWPPLPLNDYQPLPRSRVQRSIQLPPSARSGILESTTLRASWSIVMSQYSGSSDVMFAATLSGRNAPLAQINDIAGPTLTTVPVRVSVDKDLSVGQFLQTVQNQSAEMIPYEQTGLQTIRTLTGHPVDVRNLLVIQLGAEVESETISLPGLEAHPVPFEDFGSFGLQIECTPVPGTHCIDVDIQYDNKVISTGAVTNVADHFVHVAEQLFNPDLIGSRLGAIQRNLSAQHKDTILHRNAQVPPRLNRCIHEMVYERATMQPNAPAICAWDGDFTYTEMCALAASFATRLLTKFAVRPKDMVGVCMDKSKWAAVAMLAILCTGATVVPLGVDHPPSRIQTITRDTGLGTVLVDARQEQRLSGLGYRLVLVDGDDMKGFAAMHKNQRASVFSTVDVVTPDDLAWIIYTSGSTGIPKGVMLEHGALATSMDAHGSKFGFNTTTRVLQFAAHTFDATIQDIFTTLYKGGCVCIPSEHDRINRLTQPMVTMNVTCATLTSTVASLLVPKELPFMETIILVGEPVTAAAVKLWSPYATVLNAYGPSECSIHSSCSDPLTDPALAPNIGHPLASCFWVVDPNDYRFLVPVGAPGELLIEGPIQASGYLNDVAKTDASFVTDPNLMKQLGLSGNQRRLYRTGDLVRQNEDGTLTHMGRRDLQVKIRGQRVEVGEIEYQILENVPNVRTVAVEPLQHGVQDKHITLTAIMDFSDTSKGELAVASDAEPLPVTATLQARFRDLRQSLLQALPPYMVPAAYLPVYRMPMNASNKLDRRAIRELLSRYSLEGLQPYLAEGLDFHVKTAPRTVMEQQLHTVWVEVFGVPKGAVGVYDNFLQLGGDSLTAMRIVTAARTLLGVRVTVEDIFTQPTLADLAVALSERLGEKEEEDPAPYELWVEHSNCPTDLKEQKLEAIAMQCSVDRALIEDVYPCSPLQMGLMAITARQPTAYLSRQVYSLDRSSIDLAAFQQAWQTLAADTPILRTRIVMGSSSADALQVVVRDNLHWELDSSLEEYLRRDVAQGMTLGEPLVRYGLVEESSGKCYFIWTAHHALYDGWTVGALSKYLCDIYHQRAHSRPSISYARFIRYLQHGRPSPGSSATYWREQLQGDAMANWPRRPTLDYQPMPRETFHRTIPLYSSQALVTTSTILRAAWALAMAQYAGHTDVVFAATVSGRSAPVSGIADIPAPTITTVPIRIRIDGAAGVAELLKAVQRQAIDMIHYEHTGLQAIKAHVPDLASALDAGSLIVVHPGETHSQESALDFPGLDVVAMPAEPFTSHAVTLECRPAAQDITIDAHYDSDIIAPEKLKRVIDYFAHLAQQLSDPATTSSSSVADLLTLSEEDERQIRLWNSTVPPRVDKCIHEMVQEQVVRTPNSIAIHAWDGDLTYREFHDHASSLANHLVTLGVGPECLVGICKAKSKWGAVAMLAILQAGGVIMPLGLSQPVARIQNIIETSHAAFILVDEKQRSRLGPLSESTGGLQFITLDAEFCAQLQSHSQPPPPTGVTPDNASWAIFTSGSTGTPKGVIIEHGTMSTSLDEQGRWLGLDEDTRFLQFASYTFDNVITDSFATASFGGCICIPSEDDRINQLSEFMAATRVNVAMLTSTVAQELAPSDLPLLQKLILTGETVRADVVRTWLGHTDIYNAYGPTEGSMSTCTRPYINAQESSNIGHGLATRLWVVQPDSGRHLSPIGAPGELYIEGPFLARGYLNDPAGTEASFIMDPPFTQTLGLAGRRVYRTGDLVQQNEDGTLIHLGRYDSQIKIRGQRVEISEIEYQAGQHLPEASTVAIVPVHHDPVTLVAAVEFDIQSPHRLGSEATFSNDLLAQTNSLRAVFTNLYGRLSQTLPMYMVPTVFVPMKQMSRNLSGKLDRRALLAVLEAIPSAKLQRYRLGQGPKVAPSTATEKQLQVIWAEALNMDEAEVGAQDNYFHIGGDSLAAMRIAAIARSHNLKLTVTDLFKYPYLSELAKVVDDRLAEVVEEQVAPPFALITADAVERMVAGISRFKREKVADILPATDFQAMTVAGVLATPCGANFAHFYIDGDGACDIGALRRSCLQLIDAVPPLRTAYLFDQGRLLQVVLHGYEPEIQLFETGDATIDDVANGIIKKQMLQPPQLGRPFTAIAIILDSRSGRHRLVLRLTHAEYDAVSIEGIWHQLRSLCEGSPMRPRPTFSSFLNNQRQKITAETYSYWQTLLDGASMTPLWTPMPVPTTGHYPMAVANLRPYRVRLEQPLPKGITGAVLIKTAWALVLCGLSERQDVIFADTVSSRGTVDASLMDGAGCCVNLLPVRAQLTPEITIQDLLFQMRAQQIESLERGQLGFREIVHECTGWPTSTRFTSAINSLSEQQSTKFTMRGINYHLSMYEAKQATWLVDLGVTTVIRDSANIDLQMSFLPGRISQDIASNYLLALADILQVMVFNPALLVSEILPRVPKVSIPGRKSAFKPDVKAIDRESTESGDTITYSELKGKSIWEDVLRSRRRVTSAPGPDPSFSQRGGDLLDAVYLSTMTRDGEMYISPMSILEGSKGEEEQGSSSKPRHALLRKAWTRVRQGGEKRMAVSQRKRAKFLQF